jgi:hypothetical protein
MFLSFVASGAGTTDTMPHSHGLAVCGAEAGCRDVAAALAVALGSGAGGRAVSQGRGIALHNGGAEIFPVDEERTFVLFFPR